LDPCLQLDNLGKRVLGGTLPAADFHAVRLLFRLCHVALPLSWDVLPDEQAYRKQVLDLLGPDWHPWEAAAAQLERYQQCKGLARCLSAADQRLLFLLARQMGWHRLAERAMKRGGPRLGDIAAAEATSAQLVGMQPGNAAFLLRHAKHVMMQGRLQQAAAAYRQALQAAEAAKGGCGRRMLSVLSLQ